MSNVIQAAERFGDKSFTESIQFKAWCYSRYWIGRTFDESRRIYPEFQHARCERLYVRWLIRRGDEVAERR